MYQSKTKEVNHVALLKKINELWQPSEKPGLQINEVLDFGGSYETLVKQGMAILVDENGTELPLPTPLECPICFTVVVGLYEFVEHVSTHSPKKREEAKAATEALVKKLEEEDKPLVGNAGTVEGSAPAVVETEKKFKDMNDEEKKAWRINNLAKARAKKKNG